MNDIFGRGLAFDCTILEEWERDSLIESILALDADSTLDSLRFSTLEELKSTLLYLQNF